MGLAALLAGCGAAAESPAGQEVYLTRGEHGEPVFTDVAVPGAERLQVAPPPPPADAAAEIDRRIEQMLSVARALEQSRLAREQARAEARREPAPVAAEPVVVYQDRYVGYPYVYRHRDPFHRFPRRPDHPDKGAKPDSGPPPEPVLSKRFLYEPD